MAPRVDLELLAQCELDECLIAATSEKRENASEDRESETGHKFAVEIADEHASAGCQPLHTDCT